MNRYNFYSNKNDYIAHHGIKGQRWGVRRFQNPDGSLTEEGKARYLNSDGTLKENTPNKIKKAYDNHLRNETKEEAASGKLYEDNHVFNEERQSEMLNNAKQNNKFNMNFLEATQNADDMTDEERVSEYEKFLKNPYKYIEEFDSQHWRENNKKSSKPEPQKKEKVKEEKTNDDTRVTGEEEAKFWKEYAKQLEAEQNKSSNKKTEKQEAKEAKKKVEKQLKGGLISNWALMNKAMEELGFTAEQRKNPSAAEWNMINDKISEIRGKSK